AGPIVRAAALLASRPIDRPGLWNRALADSLGAAGLPGSRRRSVGRTAAHRPEKSARNASSRGPAQGEPGGTGWARRWLLRLRSVFIQHPGNDRGSGRAVAGGGTCISAAAAGG